MGSAWVSHLCCGLHTLKVLGEGVHWSHLIYFLSLRDNPSFYPMPDDLRAIASYILSGRVVSGERVNIVSVISS